MGGTADHFVPCILRNTRDFSCRALNENELKAKFEFSANGTCALSEVESKTKGEVSACLLYTSFGILGCLTGLLVPIAGLCCGVLAVMRGRLGLGSTKAKMAKAGRVLGIIACVLSIVMWVLNIILTVL